MILLEMLRWLLLIAEIVIALPVLYLCIVASSAIITARRRRARSVPSAAKMGETYPTFAILVPAHNEEVVIAKLLNSLAMLKYPRERFAVHVVADNCTDATASIVRAMGWAHVHERFNNEQRGKGYALHWLMKTLEEQQFIYDAYVVLDADSVVEPTFLHAMAAELAQGAQAMQACNTVLNGSDAPSAALRLIAMTLINHLRPLGRSGIGASSTLTGNGMCLSRELLQRYPWQAYSLAEDYQYYLNLVERGVRVRYVPEAVVRSEMPVTFAQMRTQDIRWEPWQPGQKQSNPALRLLKAGLRERDFARIEAIAEFLTPPLSFLVGSCLLAFGLSLLLWSLPALLLGILLIVGMLWYVGSGLYLLHPTRGVYRALLHAPGFMLWKLCVYFVLRKSKKHTREWIRTSRVGSF